MYLACLRSWSEARLEPSKCVRRILLDKNTSRGLCGKHARLGHVFQGVTKIPHQPVWACQTRQSHQKPMIGILLESSDEEDSHGMPCVGNGGGLRRVEWQEGAPGSVVWEGNCSWTCTTLHDGPRPHPIVHMHCTTALHSHHKEGCMWSL